MIVFAGEAVHQFAGFEEPLVVEAVIDQNCGCLLEERGIGGNDAKAFEGAEFAGGLFGGGVF